MFRKLQAVLALFCIATYASAGTTVLGTASVRGNMLVDGYAVRSDATLFNGSVVETSDASATLRMRHGVDITLSQSSRGTVYGDHFVLQRGQTEMNASGSYQVEANGLRLAAGTPNSVGIVTLTPKNTVQVAALSGSFQVRDGQGLLLSNVLPGRPLTFAIQAEASGAPYNISTIGLLDFENGHYYLTTDENVKYELVGNDLQKFVGDKVIITGTLSPGAPSSGTSGTVTVKAVEVNPGGPGGGITKTGKWLIIGTAIGGAGAVGWVIHDAEQNPVSR